MTNSTSDNRHGMGNGAAPQQPQPLYVDQRTGQYVDAYGRPVPQPHPTVQQTGAVQQAGVPQGYQQPQRYGVQAPAYAGVGGAYQAPATSKPVDLGKRKRGKGFWIGIIIGALALIAAVVIAGIMLFGGSGESKRAGSLGQLEGKTDAEIQAELNRVVEEGMFNISIASMVEFPSGTEPGELRIENVPGNQYLMQVSIARTDTGEVIYESGILDPNYHIQSDTLSVDLDPGVYPCVATFTAMDPETEDEIGQAAANITVSVQS